MVIRPSLRLCAALLLAVPLAACGEETDGLSDSDPQATTSAPTSSGATPTALEGRWLLRITGVSPEHEGEAQAPRYVWFTPATGETVIHEGDPFSDSAAGRETTLLVDAARHWAVSASRPQYDDSAPKILDLTDGTSAPLEADLPGLAGWSFDPTTPGLLRVVQRSGKISLVDLVSGEVTPDGELVRSQDEYGYYFDADTGEAYVVSLGGGANRPNGLGDKPEAPVARAGGELVFQDDHALPSRECYASAGFEAGTGDTTVFCVSGRRLSVFTRAAGEAAYTQVGEPTKLDFVTDGIDFALPPAD